jgi:DNA processing protein
LIEDGRNRILGEQQTLPGAASGPQLPAGPGAEIGRWILSTLKVDAATHIDQLLDTLENGSPSELIAALFELEMLGLVKQLPGKNFVKVW